MGLLFQLTLLVKQQVLHSKGNSGVEFRYGDERNTYAVKNLGEHKLSDRGEAYPNHYMTPNNLLSYVHFIKVPPQKCFYFQVGDEKIYPETQGESDLIVFPSNASHGVDTMTSGTIRFVVAGNVTRMNSVPSSFEKKISK